MSIVRETVKETVESQVEYRASDFSGTKIPNFHWSTITRINCKVSDECGNTSVVFDLDLMPEEMNEFRNDLHKLIDRHKRMAQVRRSPKNAK